MEAILSFSFSLQQTQIVIDVLTSRFIIRCCYLQCFVFKSSFNWIPFEIWRWRHEQRKQTIGYKLKSNLFLNVSQSEMKQIWTSHSDVLIQSVLSQNWDFTTKEREIVAGNLHRELSPPPHSGHFCTKTCNKYFLTNFGQLCLFAKWKINFQSSFVKFEEKVNKKFVKKL